MITLPANRLLCIALLLIIVPAAASGIPITRTLSTAEPGPGEIFTVSLSIEGVALGGVVETLPAGYTFAGTDLPGDRVLVREEKIAFAVMNDTPITYSVQAPASGSGDITGTWEDFLGRANGTIPASHVAVGGIETAAPESGGANPTAQKAGSSPLAVLAAVAGFLAVAGRGARR